MDNWLALLKNLPQAQEQLVPYITAEKNFLEFLTEQYPTLPEFTRREIERNLSTRKGLKFIDLLLGNGDALIRTWGVELTSFLPGENRVPRLLQILGDKNEGIKLLAAQKLGKIQSFEVVNSLISGLEENRWLPARIAQALSCMGDFAIPQLRELTRSDSEKLRRYAVEILAQINSSEAGKAITEFLGDPSPNVRKSAVKSLESFSELRLDAVLIQAFTAEQDPALRIQLIRTMGRLRIVQAIPFLQEELTNSAPEIADVARASLELFR